MAKIVRPPFQSDEVPTPPPIRRVVPASSAGLSSPKSQSASDEGHAVSLAEPNSAGAGSATRPGAKKPSVPPVDIKEVAVRTMKDDLAAAKRVAPVTPSQAVLPRRGAPIKSDQATASAKEERAFPLPAKSSAPPIAIKPPLKKKKKVPKVIGITLAAVLVLALLAGSLWWFMWAQPGADVAEVAPAVLSASDVIPANTLLVMRYRLQSSQQRTRLQQLWAGQAELVASEQPVRQGAPLTVSALLAGNPRLLLQDETVGEFFFVLLPDQPRLFLVVPQTESTKLLLAEQTAWRVLEKGNWLVAHPRDVASYDAALTARSRSQAGGLLDLPSQFSMQIDLGTGYVAQLIPSALTAGLDMPVAQPMTLQAAVDADSGVLLFTTGQSAEIAASQPVNSKLPLLELLPADASVILVGSSVTENFGRWQPMLDQTVVEQPAVQQLLSELTDTYAFYRRQGADGIEDIGLVIRLPDALQSSLQHGDETLEKALTALLPMITASPLSGSVAFTDAAYADVPLRYANIAGHTQALDYAIVDDVLVVASSKEGMFALLDVVGGFAPSLATTRPWTEVIQQGNIVSSGDWLYLGYLQHPVLTDLLPQAVGALPFGVGVSGGGQPSRLSGALVIE
jgi:hypothetical protein